jgi:hypothetical protein
MLKKVIVHLKNTVQPFISQRLSTISGAGNKVSPVKIVQIVIQA